MTRTVATNPITNKDHLMKPCSGKDTSYYYYYYYYYLLLLLPYYNYYYTTTTTCFPHLTQSSGAGGLRAWTMSNYHSHHREIMIDTTTTITTTTSTSPRLSPRLS